MSMPALHNHPATLTRLFWSRGRREFLELTNTDAARRLSTTDEQAKQKLIKLNSLGFVDVHWFKQSGNCTAMWRASTHGKNAVREYLHGGST